MQLFRRAPETVLFCTGHQVCVSYDVNWALCTSQRKSGLFKMKFNNGG